MHETSTEATSRLGAPITIGLPEGAIRAFNRIEEANLDFSVTGPKAKALAFVSATKRDGPWVLQSPLLTVEGQKAIQAICCGHRQRRPEAKLGGSQLTGEESWQGLLVAYRDISLPHGKSIAFRANGTSGGT